MGAISGGGGFRSGDPQAGQGLDLGNGAFGNGLGNGKALGGLFGTAGGAGGSGFNGPEMANVQQAVTPADAQAAQGGVNNSLASQQALLAALQGQGGLGQQTAALNQSQLAANQLSGGVGNQANVFGQGQNIGAQLAGNNGIANQGQVYGQGQGLNAQMAANNAVGAQGQAMGQQQGLNQQLANANGIGTQGSAISGLQNVAAQQQGTANMYGDIAAGRGPNPAQAALNQSTGQNVANQAALMAGQRGAGANVGLLARQAAQQGAATQQQAVGQSATLQANQQIAGLQGLSGAQQNMGATQQAIGALGTTQVGQQQSGITQQAAQAGQMVGQQQAQQQNLAGQAQNQVANQMANQQALAGQAGNQVQQQLSANQAVTGQANILGGQQIAGQQAMTANNLTNVNQQQAALSGLNNANVTAQNSVNAGNTALAQTNMQGQQAILGGVMNSGGGVMGSIMGGARGGYVGMAMGGDPMQPYAAPNGSGPLLQEPAPSVIAAPSGPAPVTAPPPGAQSGFGQFLNGGSTSGFLGAQVPTPTPSPVAPESAKDVPIPSQPQMGYGSQQLYNGASSMSKAAMKAGTMAAMAARGGSVEHDFRGGGHVRATTPTEKAVKPGNSYANDKVKALLSAGEVVIPKSVMESKDPARGAADFVSKVLAKRRVS